MSEKDKANLLAILDSCLKIQIFTENLPDADAFFEDSKTFDAVLMNFVIIGEAVTRLSLPFKEKENHIPWTKMKGFRNIVAHDYFGVDAEEVWQIVKEIPELAEDIEQILSGY
jgi:uncharacterized protein with HEPN domain